mmetsp:Transcript_1512/g.2037  ORF Transcript_1512/g.2037 Transcript_1512/m.2037 type:complete len:90 (+) Transcript_1512:24-293(+)
MLSTGSIVFKQVTSLLPFGVPGLEPFVHFIPVREDLSDLIDKLEWARAHDEEAQRIAKRGKAFADAFFTEEQVALYVLRALLRYAKLFN